MRSVEIVGELPLHPELTLKDVETWPILSGRYQADMVSEGEGVRAGMHLETWRKSYRGKSSVVHVLHGKYDDTQKPSQPRMAIAFWVVEGRWWWSMLQQEAIDLFRYHHVKNSYKYVSGDIIKICQAYVLEQLDKKLGMELLR